MATEKQIQEMKARWSTYEAREEQRYSNIKRRLLDAGFSAEELTTLKYLL